MLRKMAPMLAALGASILVTARANASPSARLVYVRDPGAAACPDEDALRQAVKRRVGYDPFFPWAKTTIVVQITGEGTSFVAHVQLVDESGLSRGARELRSAASGCSGVVDATALAISIALDMNAPVADEPRPSPVAAPSSEPPPSPVAPLSSDRAPSSVPPPRDSVVFDGNKASSSASALRADVGVDVLEAIGVAPSVVPGFDVWVATRWGVGSLGLEVRGDGPGTVAFPGGGQATVLLFAATVAPCAHAGSLFACAVGSLGWLHASGADVAVTRSGSAEVLAVGPRAGFELPVGHSLALQVHGDLLVNALRPEVSLNGTLWPLPPLSGVVAFGVSCRPWLFAFAYRVAAAHRRLARHRVEVVGGDLDRAGDVVRADDALILREDAELALKALEAVEIDRRAVFLLHELDEVPIPEVAHALGIPTSTAYSRLRLARQDFDIAAKRLRLVRGDR
jgi:Sigma-70, region 4